MQVDDRVLDLGMPEQVLNRPEISPCFVQMCGVAVAQSVRANLAPGTGPPTDGTVPVD
jgi:hypothetical protein